VSLFVLFFFFQAEDGIRDKLVTGVQTCALPISVPVRDHRLAAVLVAADHPDVVRGDGRDSEELALVVPGRCDARPGGAVPALDRSEERRVGKECRSRW